MIERPVCCALSDLVYCLDLLLHEGPCGGHEDELGVREPAVVVVHHHGRDERLAYMVQSQGQRWKGEGWTFGLKSRGGCERKRARISSQLYCVSH